MDEKAPIVTTVGMRSRSRWIWLAILGSIAGVLTLLLGSWTLQAYKIERALNCGSPCLTTHSATVWKAERFVHPKAESVYSYESVEYRVWLHVDTGQDIKVNDAGKLWSKGAKAEVRMLGDRVVLLDGRQVLSGWGLPKEGVAIFVFFLMVSAIGVFAQATCLVIHYIGNRPSHTLQTFGAMVAGLVAGVAFGNWVYWAMDAPWFGPFLSVALAVAIGVLALLRINDVYRPPRV